MRENIDGAVLNDGIYNYLGGRNFIISGKSPLFIVETGGNQPLADIAMADVAILPYDDPNELPFVIDSLMVLGNRRLYDTEIFPQQFLPYQYISERMDRILTDGFSLVGPFSPDI